MSSCSNACPLAHEVDSSRRPLPNAIARVFAIGFVFAMELLNSAIEKMADFVTLERHEAIRKVKDLSAAGVLVSALTAFAVGLIVFLPKICKLVG